MSVRVVVPVLNNPVLTAQCLASLRGNGLGPEIVVVDNGSTPRYLADIKGLAHEAKATLVHNPDTGNYSRSVNMGASAPGHYGTLIVSNNDTIWPEGSVAALTRALTPRSRIALAMSPHDCAALGVAPPRLNRPENVSDIAHNIDAVESWWRANRLRFGADRRANSPYPREGGYAFAIDRDLWDTLGGLDESFRLFGSDYLLFFQALARTNITKATGAYVEHLEHQTVAWLADRNEQMIASRFRLTERVDGLREMVSVIVPTYNRSDLLTDAIESVARQHYPHWRLYVVDDGSDDWDRIQSSVATRFRHLEGRIAFLRLPENRGPGAARNAGLAMAAGKYVAFLDSDDIWYPWHLEQSVARLEDSDDVAVYSPTDFAWRWWDESSRKYRYRLDTHPERQLQDWSHNPARLRRECYIKTSTFVACREPFAGPEGLRFPVAADHRSPDAPAEDWEVFKALLDHGQFTCLSKPGGRTHWSKAVDEEGHHSARLTPWADRTTIPTSWRVKSLVDHRPGASRISAVVPTRGRPSELVRCLTSLADLPAVVVADGRESHEYAERTAAARPHTGCIGTDSPIGPSAARNRGVEAAQTEWVWLLDDDDIPLPSWQIAFAARLPATDVILCPILVGTDQGLVTAPCDYTSGIIVRVTTYNRAGGMDERILTGEEVDLLHRLHGAGATIQRVAVPIAVKTSGAASPLGGPSTGKIPRDMRRPW